MKDTKIKIIDHMIKIVKEVLSNFYSFPCYSIDVE